jgi:hypothetical protein
MQSRRLPIDPAAGRWGSPAADSTPDTRRRRGRTSSLPSPRRTYPQRFHRVRGSASSAPRLRILRADQIKAAASSNGSGLAYHDCALDHPLSISGATDSDHLLGLAATSDFGRPPFGLFRDGPDQVRCSFRSQACDSYRNPLSAKSVIHRSSGIAVCDAPSGGAPAWQSRTRPASAAEPIRLEMMRPASLCRVAARFHVVRRGFAAQHLAISLRLILVARCSATACRLELRHARVRRGECGVSGAISARTASPARVASLQLASSSVARCSESPALVPSCASRTRALAHRLHRTRPAVWPATPLLRVGGLATPLPPWRHRPEAGSAAGRASSSWRCTARLCAGDGVRGDDLASATSRSSCCTRSAGLVRSVAGADGNLLRGRRVARRHQRGGARASASSATAVRRFDLREQLLLSVGRLRRPALDPRASCSS